MKSPWTSQERSGLPHNVVLSFLVGSSINDSSLNISTRFHIIIREYEVLVGTVKREMSGSTHPKARSVYDTCHISTGYIPRY